MYIPSNPYESLKFVVWGFLAVMLISATWNRWHKKTMYTAVWFCSFLGAVIFTIAFAVTDFHNVLSTQQVFVPDGLLIQYGYPYWIGFGSMFIFTGIAFLEKYQKVCISEKVRASLFVTVIAIILGSHFYGVWRWSFELVDIQLLLCFAWSEVSLLYRSIVFCFFVTEIIWWGHREKLYWES